MIVACLIEGERIDCFGESAFILRTVTPTAELRFSEPIRTETTLDNVRVCAESLISGRGVSAPLRRTEDVAELEWLEGNTRLRLTILGNAEARLRDGSVLGVVVTFREGVLSEDGQALAPATIGPVVFAVDLTGQGGRTIETTRRLRFCTR